MLEIVAQEVGESKVASVFFDMLGRAEYCLHPRHAYPIINRIYRIQKHHPSSIHNHFKAAFILAVASLLKLSTDRWEFYFHMVLERLNDLVESAYKSATDKSDASSLRKSRSID